MSDNLWIITNSLLEKEKKIKRNDILDFFLLIVITLLVPLLTIGRIVLDDGTHNDIKDYSDGYSFGKFYQYVNQEPNTWVSVLLFSVIGCLLLLYYILRFRHTGKKASRIFLLITVFYLCLRLVGTFLFPYGPIDFHFISPLGNDTPYTISYSGFSIGARIKQFISELLSIFYVFELFVFLPTYSRYTYSWFRILIYICIVIPIFLLVYSWIKEGNLWIENIRFFLKGGEYQNILSLTTHKNVFGYFLLIGCFSFLTLFFKKHHFIFIILAFFFCGMTLIVLSKTTFLIGMIAIFLSLLFYPIFFFSKKKKNSIFSLILLFLFCIVAILAISKYGFRKIIDKVLDPGSTLSMRINHIKIAISMFRNQSVLLLIFGYGRFPFTSIHLPYQHIIPYEALWTSHNSYIESVMHTGIIGLVYLLVLDFIFLFRIGKTGHFHKESVIYFITFFSISIYSALEPRILFLNTGFEILLAYFLIVFPLFVDYGHRRENCLI